MPVLPPPTLRAPTLRAPTLRAPTLRAPTLRASTVPATDNQDNRRTVIAIVSAILISTVLLVLLAVFDVK
jgi:hypothetical protein